MRLSNCLSSAAQNMPLDIEKGGGAPPVVGNPLREWAGLKIADLRRDPKRPRERDEIVSEFLPIVYGIARVLIPENPGAAEAVAIAVFQTFEVRRRKLWRRTLL